LSVVSWVTGNARLSSCPCVCITTHQSLPTQV